MATHLNHVVKTVKKNPAISEVFKYFYFGRKGSRVCDFLNLKVSRIDREFLDGHIGSLNSFRKIIPGLDTKAWGRIFFLGNDNKDIIFWIDVSTESEIPVFETLSLNGRIKNLSRFMKSDSYKVRLSEYDGAPISGIIIATENCHFDNSSVSDDLRFSEFALKDGCLDLLLLLPPKEGFIISKEEFSNARCQMVDDLRELAWLDSRYVAQGIIMPRDVSESPAITDGTVLSHLENGREVRLGRKLRDAKEISSMQGGYI